MNTQETPGPVPMVLPAGVINAIPPIPTSIAALEELARIFVDTATAKGIPMEHALAFADAQLCYVIDNASTAGKVRTGARNLANTWSRRPELFRRSPGNAGDG